LIIINMIIIFEYKKFILNIKLINIIFIYKFK
jgi:hypothetical protein